ncbi:unnamed protein product [Rotaria magnacalcarata]|uniref:Uncharacterized protein n=1 Tax=Rotaria magnacalcarata TaxID=392030 RepID=A0A816PQB0_9BILA|nr:unnamed protein product [Rotaria magnacalcarata]CAF2052534.1 unnamed protein product [Rotaria magnacalcarata]CAF3834757.1 unnamed protein product [Rotaria magnacalcarata]
MDDIASISTKEIQTLKHFAFVWLDSNAKQSDRIQTVIQNLEQNHIDITSIVDCVQFQQWFESYKSQKQIILILSNKFQNKIIPKFHESQSIIAIYLCSWGRKTSNRWAQKYPKVRIVSSDKNELIKQISRNLTDPAMMGRPKSDKVAIKRSHDCTYISEIENPWKKRTQIEPACLTTFQFVLIDLLTRLNKRASAMLNCLCLLMKDSIIIKTHASILDLKHLPNKTTLFFVSSECAAGMAGELEHGEAIFILENDKNKVDYRKRFDNDEDLIFQLADEIYRCCKKESMELLESDQSSLAEEKNAVANQIHVELKKAYKSVSTNETVPLNGTTILVSVISKLA